MKHILFGLIGFLSISLLVSCVSEEEKRKREIESNIITALYYQAIYSLTNPDTYSFERMNDYRVNDSIRVYVFKYSGKNAFGVKKSQYTMGYFNINTGDKIERSLLKFLADPEELKLSKAVVRSQHNLDVQ